MWGERFLWGDELSYDSHPHPLLLRVIICTNIHHFAFLTHLDTRVDPRSRWEANHVMSLEDMEWVGQNCLLRFHLSLSISAFISFCRRALQEELTSLRTLQDPTEISHINSTTDYQTSHRFFFKSTWLYVHITTLTVSLWRSLFRPCGVYTRTHTKMHILQCYHGSFKNTVRIQLILNKMVM